MSRPIDDHHADDERHRELAAEEAADGLAEPAGHDHHLAARALGHEALGHALRMWGRSTSR